MAMLSNSPAWPWRYLASPEMAMTAATGRNDEGGPARVLTSGAGRVREKVSLTRDIMKDTITAKIIIDADFETVQALRRQLADGGLQDRLRQAIEQQVIETLGLTVAVETELTVPQYRKSPSGQRDPIPKVQDGLLTWYDPYAERTNEVGKVGSEEWFDWLAQPHNASFRYISKDKAAFTAMKNEKGLWIAHKRLGGKLRRKYLGKPANLTKKKLDAVAFELAQRKLA